MLLLHPELKPRSTFQAQVLKEARRQGEHVRTCFAAQICKLHITARVSLHKAKSKVGPLPWTLQDLGPGESRAPALGFGGFEVLRV